MSLLHEPHHDGSPRYVDDEAPALGSTVRVRLRTSTADPVDQVWVRTTYDAEPTYHPCEVTARDEHTVWWEAALPVHNPVTHYRFLLATGAEQRWLSGAGVVEHDPPDAFDFRLSSYDVAAGLGARRGRLPGVPGPVRPLGRGRRAADAGVGGAGRTGTTRSSSRASTRGPRCSSSAATSTGSPSTSTTSPRSG